MKGHITDKAGNVVLYRTEAGHDTTNIAKIVDIGPKCKVFTTNDIGRYIRMPELDTHMKRVKDELWCIREWRQIEICPAVFFKEG